MTGASVTSVLPVQQNEKAIYDIMPYNGTNYMFTDGSFCTCSSSTSTTCIGLSTFENNTVPVFYNQTFINLLTNSSNQYRKLNSSFSNATIEELLNQMFVIKWTNETFFQKYFYQCALDYFLTINGISKFLDELLRLTFDKYVCTITVIDVANLIRILEIFVENGCFKSTI
ncbi:hypothetical protein I4U23_011070 [Adineta vaga]|nr:hypothetical protein I4U23_011070 [Adineta vaga]